MDLDTWRGAVGEHMDSLQNVLDDRSILRKSMEEYLSKFFEWDDVEYNRDFTKVILSWKNSNHPVIKMDIHKDLEMDFIISCGHSRELGTGVRIELYPFGLPKEGEIEWLNEKTVWEDY